MGIKIIIEKNIPFIQGLLDDIAHVQYLSAMEITAETMRDTDALITRTRTRCDASLLDGSRCRFIATATIGTDHIDLDYCHSHNITVANAPGCNAPAVAQYVFASIASFMRIRNISRPINSLTIGIVGVGHVGSIVQQWAEQLGMTLLLCDPPRADVEGQDKFVTLDRIAREADIITFHTPLTCSGNYPTHHICGASFLGSVEKTPLIINCARGEIVDTNALLKALSSGKISDTVIDCWENEPQISLPLLEKAIVATPHIAGYSREGKIRATSMALQALCRHFNLPLIDVKEQIPAGAATNVTFESIASSYDPAIDTTHLRQSPSSFETIRNTYPLRSEVK